LGLIFFDVRAQRVPSFYSHAAAHGGRRTVLRGTLRVAVLRGDFCIADRACGSVTRESLRATGTDDLGTDHREHSLLSHSYGACMVAAGRHRDCAVGPRLHRRATGLFRVVPVARGSIKRSTGLTKVPVKAN